MSQLRSNARWLAVAQLLKVAMQLISMTVLARMLEPKFYGLMAMAAAVTNFASLFRDLGASAAIIQSSNLTEEVKASVHRMSSVMGVGIGLIVSATAPGLAGYFNEPQLIGVLVLISLTFPLAGFTSVHQALVEKRGDFRLLTFVEVGSGLLGLALALLGAWLGWGVYALVIQTLSVSITTAFSLRRISDWRPLGRVRARSLLSIAGFSGNLVGFNLINYFSRNADTWIIGRALGSISLGVYAMATKIMVFPLESITYVSSRALFPVLSQHQHDLPLCGSLYFKTVRTVSLLAFPIMCGIWSVREWFVLVLFGDRWISLVEVIAWLAPVGLIRSVNSTTGTVFMALGQTGLLFKLGVYGAILHVSAYLIGVRWGLVGVASIYFFANILNSIPGIFLASRAVGGGVSDFFKAIWPALFASILMVVVGGFAKWGVQANLGVFAAFFVVVLVSAITYVVALKAIFPDCFRQMLSFVKR